MHLLGYLRCYPTHPAKEEIDEKILLWLSWFDIVGLQRYLRSTE